MSAKQMAGYSGGCTRIGGPVRGMKSGLKRPLLSHLSFSVVSGYHTEGVRRKDYFPSLLSDHNREKLR